MARATRDRAEEAVGFHAETRRRGVVSGARRTTSYCFAVFRCSRRGGQARLRFALPDNGLREFRQHNCAKNSPHPLPSLYGARPFQNMDARGPYPHLRGRESAHRRVRARTRTCDLRLILRARMKAASVHGPIVSPARRCWISLVDRSAILNMRRLAKPDSASQPLRSVLKDIPDYLRRKRLFTSDRISRRTSQIGHRE